VQTAELGLWLMNRLSAYELRYSEDQPRDDHGRFGEGSGGDSGGGLTGNAALNAAPLGLVDNTVNPVSGKITSKPGPGMTPEEAKALSSYRERGFVKVNGDLRKNDGEPTKPDTQKAVATIDAAMSRSQLMNDVSVERGISNGPAMFGDRWQGDLTGTTFVEHGYTSTTTDHNIASEFADRIPGVSDGGLARISVPSGTSAIKLSDRGPFQEAELLLDRGLTYEVVSDTGPGSGRQIEMRVK
jgi:hypothetical protein